MTREEWLTALTERLAVDVFAGKHDLPANIRVSVGWPSKGGTALSKRVIGQCWHDTASDDHSFEIFISPTLGDAMLAAETLVHELCHACLPPDVKHKRPFAKLAAKVGLEGKPTSTIAGPELRAQLEALIMEIGPYPHAELRPLHTTRVQKSRMLKAACPECGYTVRLARQWLDVKAPICPVHGREMDYDAPEITKADAEDIPADAPAA